MRRFSPRLLGALLWVVCAATSHADQPAKDDSRLPSAPLREEVLRIAGDPGRPVMLQVTLFSPVGTGPFPLAVMNHGATEASASNRGERYRFTVAAYYFLSRGYAVALPMMRGFAESGGALADAGCNVAAVAHANARDIRAVIGALVRRPDIDRTRIVIAGQSFGGWNTLGMGADPPAGVHGLVAFNPALRTSDCAAQDASMINAAGQFGRETSLPSLWFYGENDSIMPVATWRQVFDHYKAAGGRAELVDVGRFGSDSHQILGSPGSLPIWGPRIDAFLARIGMPSAIAYPDFLPHAAPPATGWAALADVTAVPFLGDKGRALYQRFLTDPDPRAFVISPNGTVSMANGGYDPLGYALRQCARATPECRAYAVNDAVVWSGTKSQGAGVRVAAKTVRMNVGTWLGGFFAVNPDCSSRGLSRVTVVQAPAHGTATVGSRDEHPVFAAGSPYARCDAGLVPSVGVTYTPAPGFAGGDALTLEDVDAGGGRQVIRIDLTVAQ